MKPYVGPKSKCSINGKRQTGTLKMTNLGSNRPVDEAYGVQTGRQSTHANRYTNHSERQTDRRYVQVQCDAGVDSWMIRRVFHLDTLEILTLTLALSCLQRSNCNKGGRGVTVGSLFLGKFSSDQVQALCGLIETWTKLRTSHYAWLRC